MAHSQGTDSDRCEAGASLPTASGIRAAAELLRPYSCETSLTRSSTLSNEFCADVWIKNEIASPIRCFKHRGALTHLLRAAHRTPLSAVVTSSSGNHGLGVAYAAKQLGSTAHVFLPVDANAVKRASIEALGATIHSFGSDIDEAKGEARAFASQREYAFVDDGESLDVIEGAGTIGLEITQSLENVDLVFIPMGSGSLAGGCGCAIKAASPSTKVIAVQSSGSPAMAESFRQRCAVTLPIHTIADGLVCREPADLALRCLLAFVDDVEVVEDGQILSAVYDLAVACGLPVEPSAAAALAAARNRREEVNRRRVVIVATGGNISAEISQALNLTDR
jgi:threonine dehydratase